MHYLLYRVAALHVNRIKALVVLVNGTPTRELTKPKCTTLNAEYVIAYTKQGICMHSISYLHTCLYSSIVWDLVGDVTDVGSARDDLHRRNSDVESSHTVLKVTGVEFIL